MRHRYPARWEDYPFVAHLCDTGPYTGTVISPFHVLTAAHCIDEKDRPTRPFRGNGELGRVEKMFDRSSIAHPIALMKGIQYILMQP